MKNWRFLIQQEGDREWLPLESLESEILEGRYRLVGQSQRQRHPVQIHLVYRDLEGGAPRHHCRVSQTNDQGLVGIFPFTRLQPGLWEVICEVDSNSAALHLQVVPQDGVSDVESDLESGLDLSSFSQFRAASQAKPPIEVPPTDNQSQPTEDSDTEVAREIDGAMASVADLFQTVEDMADQVISAMAARLSEDQSLESTLGPGAAASPKPQSIVEGLGLEAPTSQPTLPAAIELESSACILHRGQPLMLKGTISGHSVTQLPATLSLTVIEPHTGGSIVKQTYPQAIAQIPQSFSWTISVSMPHKAQLVLARLSLCSTSTSQPWPLAECSFAIMVLNEEPAVDNPFLSLPLDSSDLFETQQIDSLAVKPTASPVDLPPFLKGRATVPPETKAAALAKAAELGVLSVRQNSPESSPASALNLDDGTTAQNEPQSDTGQSELDGAAEVFNPFQYPSDAEDASDTTSS